MAREILARQNAVKEEQKHVQSNSAGLLEVLGELASEMETKALSTHDAQERLDRTIDVVGSQVEEVKRGALAGSAAQNALVEARARDVEEAARMSTAWEESAKLNAHDTMTTQEAMLKSLAGEAGRARGVNIANLQATADAGIGNLDAKFKEMLAKDDAVENKKLSSTLGLGSAMLGKVNQTVWKMKAETDDQIRAEQQL